MGSERSEAELIDRLYREREEAREGEDQFKAERDAYGEALLQLAGWGGKEKRHANFLADALREAERGS